MGKNRILSISLSNIKNVESGTADFSEKKQVESGSFDDIGSGILGFYGPNGSGKTTVVEAFQIIRDLSLQYSIYSFDPQTQNRTIGNFDYFLSLGKESGFVENEFLITHELARYKVRYRFDVGRRDGFVCITGEHLQVYPSFPESRTVFKYPFAPIDIDYADPSALPLYDGVKHSLAKEMTLPAQDSPEFNQLLRLSAAKAFSVKRGVSFLFSDEFVSYLLNHSKEDVRIVGRVLSELINQLKFRLFVFSDKLTASSYLGRSAFFGIYFDPVERREIHGLFLRMDEPFSIKERLLPIYEQMIKEVNTFISSFVPGFTLSFETKNAGTWEDGSNRLEINIFRAMNGERLPLSHESAGIKQLISLAMAFVYVYGEPSAWLVVDEMDAGVFEMLWASIIAAQDREGKGQILFTAHNLAPLERISPSSIVFATTNPKNRYVSFKGIKKTNNLRLLYLRALHLGWQGDDLSNGFDEQDIAAALSDANRVFKSMEREIKA